MPATDHARASSASERGLIIAFAAVVLSFIAATAYSQLRARAITRAALEIEQNAAPSIEHLAAARTELQRLAFLTDDYVDEVTAHRRASPVPLFTVRRRVGAEIQIYFALPTFAGERELWRQLHGELDRLDGVLERVLREVEAGDLAAAERSVRQEFAQSVVSTSDAILQIIELNARLAHDRAEVIEHLHHHSMVLAAGLDLLAFFLTVTATLLLLRAMRRHSAVMTEHTRLLTVRADEMEEFAGRVAHDIRNPLNTIELALARAERATTPDAVRTALARGQKSVQRTSLIIRDLLSFAQAGAHPDGGARAAVREVVAGALEDLVPMAEAAEVELEVAPLPACSAACEPGILTSLVSNLVHNAIKYINGGPRRRVTLRVLHLGGVVRVEVEDTGPGLEPAMQEQVFEPYVRGPARGQSGIGLGLATVKRACLSHGGRVGVQSEPGQGSTFWFELPAVAV